MFAYIGGKYRQAKWITSFMAPNTMKYAEVFVGAMWAYINGNLHPSIAYYNDYNSQMANVFACCKEYETFLSYLDKHKPLNKEMFNENRRIVIDAMESGHKIDVPDFEMAYKYIYVLTHAFSSMVIDGTFTRETNRSNKYDALKKRLRNPKIQKKLDKVKVSNLSYEEFIDSVDASDMTMYLDPPYYGTESLYASHNFTKEHHKHLADILNRAKSKWILSYYEFPEMKEWYPKDKYRWVLKDFKKGSMAKKNKTQSVGRELLIIKDL